MTWQVIPLRAATVIDRPLPEVAHDLRAVDGWQRAATAVGYRLRLVPAGPAVPAGAPGWTDGRHVRLDRIGRRRRPVARHRAQVDLDDAGLPAFTVTRGPARGGRLTVTLAETGAGVLLTVQFANPVAGRSTVDRLRGFRQSRHRRAVVEALQTVTGMAVLAAHRTRVVVAAAVVRDGAVLAARRSYPPTVAGQWEFPGGKVAPGETDAEALRRELVEELGDGLAAAEVGERAGPEISLDVELVLRLYVVRAAGEPVTAGSHDELRWVSAADLDGLHWLDADRRLLSSVRPFLH